MNYEVFNIIKLEKDILSLTKNFNFNLLKFTKTYFIFLKFNLKIVKYTNKMDNSQNLDQEHMINNQEIISSEDNNENVNYNHLEFENEENFHREPIYIMTLELEQGKATNVEIYKDTDPNELAYQLCLQYELDQDAMEFLKQEIYKLMEMHSSGEEINEANQEEYPKDDNLINPELLSDLHLQENPRQDIYDNNFNYELEKTKDERNIYFKEDNNKNLSKTLNYQPHLKEEDFNNQIIEDKRKKGPLKTINSEEERSETEQSKLKFSKFPFSFEDDNQEKKLQENINYKLDLSNSGAINLTQIKGQVSQTKNNEKIEKDKKINTISKINEDNKFEETNILNINANSRDYNPEKIFFVNNSNTSLSSGKQQKIDEEVNVIKHSFKNSLIEKLEKDNSKLIKVNSNNVQEIKQGQFSNINPIDFNISSYSNMNNQKSICSKDSKEKSDIFDKLYNDAKIRRSKISERNNLSIDKSNKSNKSYKSSKSKDSKVKGYTHILEESRTSKERVKRKEYTNKGESLYYEGIKKKEEFEKKINQIKSDQLTCLNKSPLKTSNIGLYLTKIKNNQALNQSKNASISLTNPSNQINLIKNKAYINSNQNQSCTDKESISLNQSKTQSRVYNKDYLKIKEQLIEKLKQKHYLPEANEEYTFQPVISSNSNQIIANLNADNYIERKIKKQEKVIKESTKEYTFNPVSRIRDESPLQKISFDERQKIYLEISKNKKKELFDMYGRNKDSNGQQLFKPTLSTSKIRNNDDREERNVYEVNYNYANKYNLKKQELEKKFYSNRLNESNSIKTNLKTETIYEKMKNEAIDNVFTLLDSDQDNKITPININTKVLGERSKSILSPILSELKAENETLNRIEFKLAMLELFEVYFL